VNLTRTIPVLIVYASAMVEEDGQIFFLEDICGIDKALAKLEAQAYSSCNPSSIKILGSSATSSASTKPAFRD
jgi:murein L,D-transpeptidase YcbB/YkuD